MKRILIMNIDDRRKRWILDAVNSGCPKGTAESVGKEKFYDELLATALDIADEIDSKEDDLK